MNQARRAAVIVLAMLMLAAGCKQSEKAAGQNSAPAAPAHVNTPQETADLLAAIRAKDMAQLQTLLAAGVNPNCTDELGYTPLHVAAAGALKDAAELLINKGAAINVPTPDGITPLHDAAMTGDAPTATLLLDKGAQLMALDNNGMTPLHTAALKNNVRVAEVLVQRGADVNFMNDHKWTPLRVAQYGKSGDMIAFLKLKGAKQ